MKRFLQTACVGAAMVGFAGVSQAASVKTLLEQLAAEPSVGNSTYNLIMEDSDQSLIFQSDGSVRANDLATTDIIIGTIDMSKLIAPVVGPDPERNVGSGGNQGLVGFYALKISSFTNYDTVGGQIHAVALDDTDLAVLSAKTGLTVLELQDLGFGDTSGSAMIAFYLDGDASGAAVGETLYTELDFTSVTDGTHWASFGDGTYTLTATNSTALFNAAEAGGFAGQIATVALNISEVVNNTGYASFNGPVTQSNIGASVLNGGDPDDVGAIGPVLSDISFRMNITIPSPAAVLPGLVLLGLAAVKRNRRLA